MKLSEQQVDFVERMGRFWESISGTRTAGRILGWLMICEPDHQSATDLTLALDISGGSVSTQVRLLEQLGLVERVTFRGNRASHYRLPDRVWSRRMDRELDRIIEMRKITEAAAGVVPAIRPERVTEMGLIADFFADEWPQLMNRLTDQISKDRI